MPEGRTDVSVISPTTGHKEAIAKAVRHPEEEADDCSDGHAHGLVHNSDEDEGTWLAYQVCRVRGRQSCAPRAWMFCGVKAGTILENMRHGRVMFCVRVALQRSSMDSGREK